MWDKICKFLFLSGAFLFWRFFFKIDYFSHKKCVQQIFERFRVIRIFFNRTAAGCLSGNKIAGYFVNQLCVRSVTQRGFAYCNIPYAYSIMLIGVETLQGLLISLYYATITVDPHSACLNKYHYWMMNRLAISKNIIDYQSTYLPRRTHGILIPPHTWPLGGSLDGKITTFTLLTNAWLAAVRNGLVVNIFFLSHREINFYQRAN